MKVILKRDNALLLKGDAKDIGELLPVNYVDAVVTDPPAGISFMSKGWDSDKGGRDKWITWFTDLMKGSLKVLKPGGYALVWAIPRTSHWTATALENAGFEIRDIHHHLFGTGFPKSLTSKSADIPEGTGSALKPAVEHWILARKPLDGTYSENYKKHGTGVLNIDACRIEGRERTEYGLANATRTQGSTYATPSPSADFDASVGRWPAHLSMDENAAAMLDEQSGSSKLGGASRFFYVAKAPRSEKDAGLEHLPVKGGGEATGRAEGSAGVSNPRAGAGRTGGARNIHPTVKNLALMKWLITLVTPPGGIVLDPFAGSGSTGVAALELGFSFVGCELGGDNDEYIPILLGRIEHALKKIINP